jgi:hypothetical protein
MRDPPVAFHWKLFDRRIPNFSTAMRLAGTFFRASSYMGTGISAKIRHFAPADLDWHKFMELPANSNNNLP